jgi:3-oxoadipate enol-lactonase
MWDRQESAFARKYRVVRYDRRGFGKSSGGEDITWDASDLTALLDTLGMAKAHILGMSQGARVALQFARAHPERVSSLVLQGAPPPDGFGLPWTGPDRTRFDEWGTLAREQGMDAFRRVWTAHPLMAIPAGKPDARALLNEQIAAYGGGRFLKPATPSGPVKPITMDDLSRLDMPALVLIGENETPYLQIAARAFAYYMPGATLAVIPGGGHLINMIEPARYNTAVLDFLAGLQKRAK